MSYPTSDFHSRQNAFIPAENLKDVSVLIVGCGAIGRNVASNVARLGVKSITLVDHDIVEAHNIVPQNWKKQDCGRPKVDVLAEEIIAQMGEDLIEVKPFSKKWAPRVVGADTEYTAVWSTVDNIDVRRVIYNYYRDKADHFFDVRIGYTVAQILTVQDLRNTDDWYLKTIFPAAESASWGCIQPMSNYIANIAAGASVNQFANIMGKKGWPANKMLSYCAISSTLLVEKPNEYFGAIIDNNKNAKAEETVSS